MQDLRYAVRWLARNPGFTAVAIATLALAVGVNAAIFTFVRGVVLRPLPYPKPGALVQVWEKTERDGQVQGMVPLSYPNFLDYRRRNRSFESMAAYSDTNFNLTGRGVPEQVSAGIVSASFFRVLGVAPVAGRTFHDDEDQPGHDGVAVITRRFWQSHFSANPAAVGTGLTLNGRSYVVIGVVPSGLPVFNLDPGDDIFVPVTAGFSLDRRGAHWLGAIGRLRDGVSLETARADLARIAAELVREFPDNDTGFSCNALLASEQIIGPVQPVPRNLDGIRSRTRHSRRVRDHGDHRARYLHWITMCDNECRIWEGGVQGGELFEVLRGLQYPAGPAAQPLHGLQLTLEVGIRRSLVVGLVVRCECR